MLQFSREMFRDMQLSENPLVSIVIPSFNQGQFIGETIESILSQNYRPLEVIVMDGASTDETLSVLDGYRNCSEVRVWSELDKGVVDAINKGLREARGAIWAIQSSDDTYLPGAIEAAVEALRANPKAGLVFGDVELIDENSQRVGSDLLGAFEMAEYLGRLTYIPQPSAFFLAEAGRAVGTWRPEVSYCPDADFWIRIALRYGVTKIDRVIARYRYHPAQRDKHQDRILRDWERMISDLKSDPNMTPKLNRYASMGVHLARYRYTAEEHWFMRTLHLYRAVLVNPAAVAHPHFPKRDLLPGRQPIWAMLSRAKRALGFRPRGQ